MYTKTEEDFLFKRIRKINEESYQEETRPNTLSTTQLIKQPKQISLDLEYRGLKKEEEVLKLLPSVLGTVVHNAILEKEPDRQEKEVNGYTITGGADKILNGQVWDLKFVKVFNYIKLKRELTNISEYKHLDLMQLKQTSPSIFKYVLQLSVYNWLYDLKTEEGFIYFIHPDYGKQYAKEVPSQAHKVKLSLYSHSEVVTYIKQLIL
jgi:hypothetical protein